MLKACGKAVNSLRTRLRISNGQLSTESEDNQLASYDTRGQHQLFPYLSSGLPPQLSPLKNTISPLFEHYFYPVSTAPIIRTTKENLKERY
jgi:hypothetical protein